MWPFDKGHFNYNWLRPSLCSKYSTMNKPLILDEAKYRLFMSENAGWQDTIKAQVNEIPAMLESALHGISETVKKDRDTILRQLLVKQKNEMKQLDDDIETQQQRLVKDCELSNQYDIDAFCTQDILRERIRAIEKAYIDLKCNFLNYVTMIS